MVENQIRLKPFWNFSPFHSAMKRNAEFPRGGILKKCGISFTIHFAGALHFRKEDFKIVSFQLFCSSFINAS